jgi:hypothetical protein
MLNAETNDGILFSKLILEIIFGNRCSKWINFIALSRGALIKFDKNAVTQLRYSASRPAAFNPGPNNFNLPYF